MNVPYDIPDDPEDLLNNPDFQAAQVALLDQIQAIPGKDLDLSDSLYEYLYTETDPEHVFPELEDCTCDKQSDEINIALRAYFSHEHAVIVPHNGPGTDLLETRIGIRRSTEFIGKLKREQKIAVLQYAFSVRCDQLYTYLALPGNIDEISRLSLHITNLHDMFDRQIHELLQET